MKNKKINKSVSRINKIKKSKYFVSGIIVGLGMLSFGTYAATMGAGTIGSLFKEISGSYFLMGNNIENGTVSLNKLESNSVDTTKIVNRTILEEDLNVPLQTKINDKGNNTANYITKANPLGDGFNDSDIYQNGLLIGIGTVNPTAKLEVNGNIISALPTANGHVANKEYVDNLLAGGGGGTLLHDGTYWTNGGEPFYCYVHSVTTRGESTKGAANEKHPCGTGAVCISGQCVSPPSGEYYFYHNRPRARGYPIQTGQETEWCSQQYSATYPSKTIRGRRLTYSVGRSYTAVWARDAFGNYGWQTFTGSEDRNKVDTMICEAI